MDEPNEMTLTQKIGAWGHLLRLPNLFTAPWDPLCGFLIAGGMLNTEKTIYLAVAAFCAYAFGLVTNDIAEMSADGSFVIAGRLDNVIVTGGIKVIPEQVEAALAQHLHCPLAVTSVPDGKFGEAVAPLEE